MTAPGTLSYAEARQALGRAQKTNRGTPAYSRWVNRPLGRRLAALAFCARRTPNQVTIASAAATAAGLILIMTVSPTWPQAVVVTALLAAGYALDSADGQLARLLGRGSLAGEWLDHVVDAVKTSSFHLAVAVAWYRFFDLRSATPVLIPLGFAVVSTVFYFALMLTDSLRRLERVRAGLSGVPMASVDPDEAAPMLRSLLATVNDYGLLILVMLLLPAHAVFVAVYTVLAVGNASFLVAGGIKWFREMVAADAVRRVVA